MNLLKISCITDNLHKYVPSTKIICVLKNQDFTSALRSLLCGIFVHLESHYVASKSFETLHNHRITACLLMKKFGPVLGDTLERGFRSLFVVLRF